MSGPVARAAPPLFGAELEAVVAREGARGAQHSQQPPVPLIIRRCVEEIERRGLDIIGNYSSMHIFSVGKHNAGINCVSKVYV